MKKLLLIGAGGHCKSCIDVIEQQGLYEIAGVIDKPDATSKVVLGYPVIGTDDQLASLKQHFDYAFITIGHLRNVTPRIKLYELLRKLGYQLPVIVSPLSYVSKHAKVGAGTIIMHHVIVNADAEIGNNCIINTKALVEHDAQVGNHCHVSTNAVVNGGVNVGERSFIGSSATTKQYINIPTDSFIKAGSLTQ
ncbi:MAG: acetyltransferase [Thiothrix sp.]|nr:MAG: acetyltransferase [Thiothrix sp.]